MTLFGKIVAIVLILAAGMIGAQLIFAFRPQAETTDPPRIVSSVEAITLKRQTIQVTLPSQGILEPLTETQVAAEVSGKVTRVSPRFEVGEAFAVDETILEIDSADYVAAVAQAEATLAEAKLALETEEAKGNQARREWEQLGGDSEPTDLVLRKPQLNSARARIVASEAALEKARRDLDRTVIRAPYACKVRAKHTDIGSFLAPGAPIADLYRTDALEIRLPVSLEDYSFLAPDEMPPVELTAEVSGKQLRWTAELTRTEGVVERSSRSVFLVARIDPQSDQSDSRRFLTPGMFVKADVSGVPLENVFRVPREAVYGTDQVLVIDNDNRVGYRTVNVVRTEQDYVIVSDGLKEGEKISVTPLETVVDGVTEVEIKNLNGVERSASDEKKAAPEGDSVPVS